MRLDGVRHLAPGLLPDRVQNVAHREAGAGAKIEAAGGMSSFKKIRRRAMRRGEIGDMDVVADRGAIGCVVVIAVDGEVDICSAIMARGMRWVVVA
jgi:hypothetical protein